MRISHLSWVLSSRGGGIPPVVLALAEAQREAASHDVQVLGIRDGADGVNVAGAREFRALGPIALGLAPRLALELFRSRPEVVHLHGLFTWPSQAAQLARRFGRARLVVSPHGMLEPWALARSAWKKRFFLAAIDNGNLQRAAFVHALCEQEAANIRAFGVKAPIATIPNGVCLADIPAHRDKSRFALLHPGAAGRRIVLFLARVHPKKGLPHLLEAWASVSAEPHLRGDGWLLVIAGPDQLGHAAEMRARAAELGIQEHVLFTGPLHGEAKKAALSAADLFVLPSFSEGFSIAVLEALAARVPVVLTRQCNFDVAAFGSGVVVEPDADSTYRGLRALMDASEAERRAYGDRGRAEVEAHYQWPVIARRMLRVYEWALGGGPLPSDEILQ